MDLIIFENVCSEKTPLREQKGKLTEGKDMQNIYLKKGLYPD